MEYPEKTSDDELQETVIDHAPLAWQLKGSLRDQQCTATFTVENEIPSDNTKTQLGHQWETGVST